MDAKARHPREEPSAPATCPRCDTPLKPGVLDGLCLRCVARGFLRPEFEPESREPWGPSGFLSPEERRFGDFELVEEIGRGGMGVVFRARQRALGREVALKFLLHGALAGDAAEARFRNEAQAAASLRHPHIVGVHEVGEHRGHHYLVMELVRGHSLVEMLRNGPVPVKQAIDWMLQATRAVEHAHQAGVIHRDLKPSNILLDELGSVRVSDFGLAKRTGTAGTESSEGTPTLSGQVLGTPAYLSPEQAVASRQLDARSDVYALGAVLYHLLTGRPPFQGESPAQILRQVVDTDPVAPRLLLPDVPRDLETICLRCLEKEPDRRYASAAAMADDLERFRSGLPIAARPITALGRLSRWARRQPELAASLSAVILLLVGIAVASRQSTTRIRALQERTLELLYASDMRLAQDSLARGRHGAVRQLLDRHLPAPGRPDLRGFEWFHLNAEVGSEAVTTLGVHDGQAQRAVWSADGLRLATASTELRVWDVDAGREFHRWQGSNYFRAVAFSPDQRLLAAAETTGGLVCFDLRSGARLARHEGLQVSPFALQWRDADTLTVWSQDRLDSWQIRSNTIQPEASLPHSSNRDVVTSGGLLLSGRRQPDQMEVWRGTNQVAVFPAEGIPFAFAGSGDGTRFALGEFNGSLSFWTLASNTPTRRVQAHQGLVNVLTFSPDGTRVASAGVDGSIRIWASETGQQVGEWRGHRSPIWSLAFSPDGTRLVAGDGAGQVKLWSLQEWDPSRAIPEHEVLMVSRDLGIWATAGPDTNVVTLRRSDRPGDIVVTVPVQTENGRVVAVAASALLRRDAEGLLTRESLDGTSTPCGLPPAGTGGVLLDPSGRFVAYPLAGDREWGGFELASRRELVRGPSTKGAARVLAFSPNRRWVALGDLTGSLRVLRLTDGGRQFERQAHAQHTYAAAFSHDGTRVATAGHDGRVRLWEVASGHELAEFQSTVETYWSVALSPDGTRVAAGTGESGVVLWNVSNRLEVAHFTLHTNAAPVEAGLAFSADGARLLAQFHQRVISWETRPRKRPMAPR